MFHYNYMVSIMKKLRYIFLSLVLLTAGSCKKYLETVPQDFISPVNYYSSEQDLNTALAGVYDAFAQDGTYARNLALELTSGTDESFRKRDDATIFVHKYNHDASETQLGATWKQLYDAINRANLLLANVDKPAMDVAKRNNIKGQALFLRAHAYFLLVSLWGDVPLIIEPVTSAVEVNRARTASATVYAKILEDMTAAEGMVNAFAHPGTISKSAVQGILARVCLKMAGFPLNDVSKYALAKSWAEKVILSGVHKLHPDYKQIFINQSADLYDLTSKETIWEIEFFGNNVGTTKEGGRHVNQQAIRFTGADAGLGTAGYGYAAIAPTATLFKRYGTATTLTDVRRDWNIAPFRYTSNTNSTPVNHAVTEFYNRDSAKWRRQYEVVIPKSADWSPTNFPMLRYADVLLMYAEAENELNGPSALALQNFNAVRSRALASTTYPIIDAANPLADVRVDSKENFRNAIMGERARELAFEGLRKMDLIRWKVLIPVLKAVEADIKTSASTALKYSAIAYTNAAEKHYLLPIPTLELSLNKSMTQNPGWF
jgi:hypothetical protein